MNPRIQGLLGGWRRDSVPAICTGGVLTKITAEARKDAPAPSGRVASYSEKCKPQRPISTQKILSRGSPDVGSRLVICLPG
jgi:hypothetical protein